MFGSGRLGTLTQRAHNFWQREIWRRERWPATASPRLGRTLIVTFRTLYLVGTGFARERLKLRAAALTYVTLLSLVPALAVAFSVFTAVGGLESVGAKLKILVLESLVGSSQTTVVDYLEQFIANARPGRLGAIGTAFLVLAVVALLSDVERAFNDIWGVTRGRTLLQRFQVFWPLITLGPLLVALSFSVTAAVTANEIVMWAEDTLLGFDIVGRTATTLLICLFFSLAYHIVPNTSVRVFSAAVGGLVAGLLWVLAQQLYAFYATYAITVSALYGSLSAVPLFIVWVFVSWNIILLGAAMTFAVQSSRSYEPDRKVSQDERELVGCNLVLVVCSRFVGGLGATEGQYLIDQARVPPRVAHGVLEELVDRGILTEAQTELGLGYVPARPLDQLTLYEVVRALRSGGTTHQIPAELTDDVVGKVVSRTLRDGDARLREALTTRSIAELISDTHRPFEDSGAHKNPLRAINR